MNDSIQPTLLWNVTCSGKRRNFMSFVAFRTLALAITACVALPASPARAETDDYANPDRPGIADGSKVVGAGRAQVELGLQEEFRNDGDERDRRIFIPTLLRLGLSNNFEARVETNGYTWETIRDPSGFASSHGNAPISIGAKYQFASSQGTSQPSVGIIARVFPPSGSSDFGTHRTTGDLRIAADWDIAPKWSVNPNIGVAESEDDQGRSYVAALFAFTLNFNPSKRLNLFIDTGEQAPEMKDGRTSAVFDGGIAFMANKDIQLDFSVGTKIYGRTPPHPFLAVGISKRF